MTAPGICTECGDPFDDDEGVYQIRYGHVVNGDFEPDSDVGWFHSGCWFERRRVTVELAEELQRSGS